MPVLDITNRLIQAELAVLLIVCCAVGISQAKPLHEEGKPDHAGTHLISNCPTILTCCSFRKFHGETCLIANIFITFSTFFSHGCIVGLGEGGGGVGGGGGGGSSAVGCATPGEEVPASILAEAARSLLVESVSV